MPPPIPTYSGPSVVVRAGTPVLATDNSKPATNINNIVAADGNMVVFTATLNPSVGLAQSSNVYRLPLAAPYGQSNARILAWRANLQNITVSKASGPVILGVAGVAIQPVDQSNATRGSVFLWHELDGGPFVTVSLQDEYSGNASVLMAEGWWAFGCGAALTSTASPSCARFSAFNGFNIDTRQEADYVGVAGDQVWTLDSIYFEIAYTPVDPGRTVKTLTQVSAAVENVDQVSGASLGVAADPDWGSEVAWDDPTQANTHNTTFVNSGGMSGATYAQTQFLRGRFASGALGDTTGQRGVQFRLPVSMFSSPKPDGTLPLDTNQAGWAALGDLVLLDIDGNVLARAANKPLYDQHNFKIGTANAGANLAQRTYEFCVDISHLTAAQLADLNTRGGRWAIRFKLYAPQNDVGDTQPTTVSINSFTRTGTGNQPTISLSPAIPRRRFRSRIRRRLRMLAA